MLLLLLLLLPPPPPPPALPLLPAAAAAADPEGALLRREASKAAAALASGGARGRGGLCGASPGSTSLLTLLQAPSTVLEALAHCSLAVRPRPDSRSSTLV